MMKSVTKEKVFHVLKLVLLVVTVTLVLLSLLGTVAHASGLVDDTVNADNLYSKYPLSNYQLDFYVDNSWSWLPWNWLDGIGKSVQYGLYCITNFVWTISLYLSNATGYVVQQAYKLDFINDMADSIGKSIQTLAGVTENGFSSSGFYVGFLLIIILIVGVYTAYTGLLKRETSKALHAVINFVVVFIVSASFIAYAPNYIQKINDFSSDISTASLDLGTKIMLPDSQSKGKDSVDLIRDCYYSSGTAIPKKSGLTVWKLWYLPARQTKMGKQGKMLSKQRLRITTMTTLPFHRSSTVLAWCSSCSFSISVSQSLSSCLPA